MGKPGRRKIQVTSSDLEELNAFLDQLRFMTKQQERFNQISDKTEFSEDEQKMVKANLREMKAHQNRLETLEMIKFKSKTTQPLTDLEKEILSYNLSNRDDFFNCHKALNTHIRLQKIAHNEIKRIDQKVRNERIQKVRKEQTEAQKQRTAENRHKYFMGATVSRLKQMLGFDDMNDLDFLKQITNSALLWSAANQEYNLKKPEYYERITSLITNKVDEVEDFIEQAKNDARQ